MRCLHILLFSGNHRSWHRHDDSPRGSSLHCRQGLPRQDRQKVQVEESDVHRHGVHLQRARCQKEEDQPRVQVSERLLCYLRLTANECSLRSLGDAIQTREVHTSKFEPHDSVETPLHTFVFKYRSRSLLQAMDIVDGECSDHAPQELPPIF